MTKILIITLNLIGAVLLGANTMLGLLTPSLSSAIPFWQGAGLGLSMLCAAAIMSELAKVANKQR